MVESAVRYFTLEGSRLPKGWRAKVQERVKDHLTFLGGGAAADFAEYRYRCGQIQALYEAIEICEQLEKDEGN